MKDLKGRVTKITETVDKETGELQVTATEYTIRTKTPHFTMVLEAGLQDMLAMLTHAEIKVFLALGNEAKYNENTVNLSPKLRKNLAEIADVNFGTFGNALTGLEKKGFIFKDSGEIKINHSYIWRGETKVHKKLNEFKVVKKNDWKD